jgi:hypothetical protein
VEGIAMSITKRPDGFYWQATLAEESRPRLEEH